ncbi:hypothetical protein [uncultured Megasphaera sp.]|uniref:hypothetical protein n=1 Tax=uncultured Megasphaera sp. TaxID=165188 RepID=UPI00266DC3DE|nr:hypothetical protein [uncultured Megasphaera sp.]
MIIFVLLMAVGALARRYEILTPANQPQITKLVVNIAYPAIILSGVTGKGPALKGRNWPMPSASSWPCWFCSWPVPGSCRGSFAIPRNTTASSMS